MSEITKIKVGDKTYDISDGAAITAITLNGEDVPVENNTAQITVGEPTYDADSETLVF